MYAISEPRPLSQVMGDVCRRRQLADVQDTEREEGSEHVKTCQEAGPKDKVGELIQLCCVKIFACLSVACSWLGSP